MRSYEGELHLFFEQGMESTYWAFIDNVNKGYDALHTLDDGDLLTIYDAKKENVLWQGSIHLEFDSNMEPVFYNPKYRWQRINGTTVHGVQKNVDAVTWLGYFRDGLPATLQQKMQDNLIVK